MLRFYVSRSYTGGGGGGLMQPGYRKTANCWYISFGDTLFYLGEANAPGLRKDDCVQSLDGANSPGIRKDSE